jgi:hypothetical protein
MGGGTANNTAQSSRLSAPGSPLSFQRWADLSRSHDIVVFPTRQRNTRGVAARAEVQRNRVSVRAQQGREAGHDFRCKIRESLAKGTPAVRPVRKATGLVACQNPVCHSTTVTTSTVSGTMSGSAGDNVCDGTVVDFYNVPDVIETGTGRMTGGGGQITVGGVTITRGFTIHCDILLSNNLEINWDGASNWHLGKPLTSAVCTDDPNIDQAPPAAPFDTFIGQGIGKLNGVDGSLVKFTFIDAGEPGKNDMAKIQIFDAGGALVLDVPLSFLDHGNIQAYFDQPHKNP